jgi:hypothetical protein
MESLKIIVCINRAVALGYMSREIANELITTITIIENHQ